MDAQAAFEWVKSNFADRKIFVFGRSIGGAVAIHLVHLQSNEFSGIIVENTFTSLEDMVHLLFPFLRPVRSLVKLVQRVQMKSVDKIPSIHTPMLFISGSKDALVPPEQMQRLYDSAPSVLKILHKVPEGTHNTTWQACPNYYAVVNKFLKGALRGSSREEVCLTSDLKSSSDDTTSVNSGLRLRQSAADN